MTDSEINADAGSKTMKFAGGALAVAAAVALFLYADGYFDRPDGLELKLQVPQTESRPA